jgi:hypothetical protein
MVVAQAVLATAEETIRVDFYAGIAALCVLILFAKFSTHDARHKKAASSGSSIPKCGFWWWVHLLCVVFAWSAIALSLYVLGWGDPSESYEHNTRWIVAGLAALASFGLAMDLF